MIYFMQATDGGPVKIGHSGDVDRRRGQLECVYGHELAILATMEGGEDEERAIHERFAHLRLAGQKKRGRKLEQFSPAPELMELIGRPLLVAANSSTVEAMPARMRTIRIRVSDAYAEWLFRAAKHNRLTVAQFFEQAVVARAKAIGFTEPPPERIP